MPSSEETHEKLLLFINGIKKVDDSCYYLQAVHKVAYFQNRLCHDKNQLNFPSF